MAQQTFTAPVGSDVYNNDFQAGWSISNNRPRINSDFITPPGERFFARFYAELAGTAFLSFDDQVGGSDSANSDLTAEFEANGTVTIVSGSLSLTVALAGADLTDNYRWTPANSAEVTAFFNALRDRSVDQGAGTITIRDFELVAPSFSDDTGDAISSTVGTAIANVTVPEADGVPAPTYAVVGTLPGGISFNTTSRVLSGTPTTVGTGTISIRATNSEGTDDWTASYSFVAAPFAPSFSDDTGTAISATVGTAITTVTVPVASGNPSPTYAVVGNLPGGLSFNTGNRRITGTPTTAGTGTIRIRATNDEGTDDWTVAYTIIPDLELDDFTPPNDHIVIFSALIEAGGSGNNIYRHPDNGAARGSIVEGGLVTQVGGVQSVTRLRWANNVFIVNDNPFAASIADYFQTGNGLGATLWIQDADDTESFIGSDNLTGSSSGNVIRFDPPNNFGTVLGNISTGSRFIFALTRAAVSLDTTIESATPEFSADLYVEIVNQNIELVSAIGNIGEFTADLNHDINLASFQVPTREEVILLALFGAGGNVTLYDGRTGTLTGLLLDGEIEIDGLTINRIRDATANHHLVINRTGSTNFNSIFGTGGDYEAATFYIQTVEGIATYNLPGEIDAISTGNIRLDGSAADDAILAGIEVTDRFILAITIESTEIELATEIESGTPEFSADLDVELVPEDLELVTEIESSTPTFSADLNDVSGNQELDVTVEPGTPTFSAELQITTKVLYCVNNSSNELWVVSVGNVSSSELVGVFPDLLVNVTGLASHDGKLYCVGDGLWEINTIDTLASSRVGVLPSSLGLPFGLTSHEGTLYCVDSAGDELWEIDLDDPSASTLLGDFPTGLTAPNGLASHNGILYCVDTVGDELWEIDVVNPGSSTLIGDFPNALGFPQGLASHEGTLYCVDNGGDELWEIDVDNPRSSIRLGIFPEELDSPSALASHEGLPRHELVLDLDSDEPTFSADLEIDGLPITIEVSSSISSDTPTFSADLVAEGRIDLDSSIESGTPTFIAELEVENVVEDIELESRIDTSSGIPTFSAVLDVEVVVEDIELESSLASGAPVFSAELDEIRGDQELVVTIAPDALTATSSLDVYTDIDVGSTISAGTPTASAEITVEEKIEIVSDTQIQQGLLRVTIDGQSYNSKESPDRFARVVRDSFSCDKPLNGVPTASLDVIDGGIRLNFREVQIDDPDIEAYFALDVKRDGTTDYSDGISDYFLTDHDNLTASTLSPLPSLFGSVNSQAVPSGDNALISTIKIEEDIWAIRLWVRFTSLNVGDKQTLAYMESGGTRLLDLFYRNGQFNFRLRHGSPITATTTSSPVPSGFSINEWIMVSAWREGRVLGIALNGSVGYLRDLGSGVNFTPSENIRFGESLQGLLTSITYISGGTGESQRAELWSFRNNTRLTDIDIGKSVIVGTEIETFRDIALRYKPAIYYPCDENGIVQNSNSEVIVNDISGNNRHAVGTHPALSALDATSGSGLGYDDSVGSTVLDPHVIFIDALNNGNTGQIQVFDPAGRFEDIDIDIGFKRVNAVDTGMLLGIYSNDLGDSSTVTSVTQGIPIEIDTSVSNRTRFILKQGRVGRSSGTTNALEDDEGIWRHTDGTMVGSKTFDRNFVNSVGFVSSNGNANAILELVHPTAGINAPTYLPSSGTRTGVHVNDASEFRFRIICAGNRLKLFSTGNLGTFLVAYAEFYEDWFPFQLGNDSSYVDPALVGDYFFIHANTNNETDNAIAITRFGPRTRLDWRHVELFSAAVPYGGAPRARLSSADQQAILREGETAVSGSTTACCWGRIEVIGAEDISFIKREDNSGNGWELGIDPDLYPYMKYKRSGQPAIRATGTKSVDFNEWFFLAGIVSRTRVLSWLNNSEAASVSNTTTSQPSVADLVIGQSEDPCRILFDEVAMFRRELLTDDLASFYASRNGERIFAGYVVGPDLSVKHNIRKGSLQVAGYADRLSRRKVYPDPDNLILVAPSKAQLGDIATNLILNYADGEGITTHGIRQVGEIDREVFAVQSVMECIDTLSKRHAIEALEGEMAQVFGVDEWKDTFFRNRALAYKYPHLITSDMVRSMSYSRDITEFGNVFYVTGGPDSVGQRQEERFVGDGSTRSFALRFPAREISEVYFDNQLEAHSGDGALWSFDPNNFFLSRGDGEPTPLDGEEIIVDYRFSFPTLGFAQSDDSIAEYGKFERSIEDEKIDEADYLRSRAQDEVTIHDDPASLIDVDLVPGALSRKGFPIIREGMLLDIDLRRLSDGLRRVTALVDAAGISTDEGDLVHKLSLKIKDHEDVRIGHWKKQRTPVRTPSVRFSFASQDRADPGDVLFSGLGLPLFLGGSQVTWIRSKDWINIPEFAIGRFDGSQLGGISALVYFMAQVKPSTAVDASRQGEVRLFRTTGEGGRIGSVGNVVSTTPLAHVVRRVRLDQSLSNYVLQAKCNSNCPAVAVWAAQIVAGRA